MNVSRWHHQRISQNPTGFCDHRIEKEIFKQLNLNNDIFNLAVWTIKESLGKALKCGLGISPKALLLDTIKLKSNEITLIFSTTFKEFYFFNCFTFVSDTYVLSFALPKFLIPINLPSLAENLHTFLGQKHE